MSSSARAAGTPAARRAQRRAAVLRIAASGGGVATALAATALLAPPGVAAWAAAPALVGWLFYVGPRLKPFMPAIEAVDVGDLVDALGRGLDYAPRAYIAEETYWASRLVAGAYDAYSGGHLIEGTLGGRPMRLSKLRVARRVIEQAVEDPDAPLPHGLPRFRPVFIGVFYEITLPVPIDGHVVALPKGRDEPDALTEGLPPPGGEPVKLGDVAFDAVYTVYASDPALAQAWLPLSRRTALLAAVVESDRPVALSFVNDKAYVAAPGTRAFFESVQVRSEADPPARELMARELRAILALPGKLELTDEA